MRTFLALSFLLTLPPVAAAQCEIERLAPAGLGFSISLTGGLDGDVAVVGHDQTEVTVFERLPGGWTETHDFTSAGFFLFEPLRVACSEDLVVTGVVEDGNLEGRAYVYERSNGYQSPVMLKAQNAQGLDTFGSGIAIHGDTLLIGASMMVQDVLCGPGKSFVFEKIGGTWTEVAEFHPYGYHNPMDNYGVRLDTDGQTAVVGASTDDAFLFEDTWWSNYGAVYVYERDVNGAWSEAAKLYASTLVNGGLFGSDVAVEGDTILVGASGTQSAGVVYEFRRGPSGWVETQVFTAGDVQAGDDFGSSVSLSGDRAAIGASGVDAANADVGAVYGFQRIGGTWIETSKIVADDANGGARFGETVDLDGNQVLWLGWWNQFEARLSSLGISQSANFCTSTANSTGAAATISAEGCDSILGNGLTLTAVDLPPNQLGLVFFSDTANQVPFGNGYLCLSARILRLPVGVSSAAGVLSTTVDFQTAPAHVMTAGTTWLFQAYYRDPGFGANFDTSDAIQVALQP